MTDFVATEHIAGTTVVLELSGRLDGSATSRMEQLRAVLDRGTTATVLLDFAGVDYINSTGIALIVGLAAKAWTTHLPVQVCGLNEHYQHIFRITRIADFVSMFADQAEALAAAAGDSQPVP